MKNGERCVVIAGTPGAERPMGPFLPPGFTM